jgi:long-chain fatty acid transport protein
MRLSILQRPLPLLMFALLLSFNANGLFGMASSGFSNEAVAARALGKYNCVTAQADDPTAIFFNPAGLTQLDGWDLSVNDTMLDIDTKHTSYDGQTTRGTTDLLHAPSFFITHGDHGRGFAYGLGVYAPFGLETEWDGQSFARYSATLSRLDVAMITPAFAYKISSALQIGVGVDIALATDVDLRKKVYNGPASPDGDSRQQATGHGVGMNAGIRFVPTPRQAIGLTYRSPIDLPLDGTQKLSGLSGPAAFAFGGSSYEIGAHARIRLPQSVVAGYAFSPTPRWRWESDLQWTDWTSIDSFHVTFDENNPLRQSVLSAGVDPLHRDWRAVWSLGAGSEYDLTDKWTLRGGLGYLWGAVPETSFDPSLPDSNRVEVTAGFTRRLFARTLLHFAYNGVFFNARNISNHVDGGNIDGRYDTVINVYSVGVEQKF